MAAQDNQLKSPTYRQNCLLKEFVGSDVGGNEYRTNPGKISKLLQGAYSPDKTKKYWVDNKGQDCFAIYARGLKIQNSGNNSWWQWKTGDDGDGIEVAQVVNSGFLEVKGSFMTRYLPTVNYQIFLRLKITDPNPSTMKKKVNLKVTYPNGTKEEKQAALPDDSQWHDLVVGRFNTKDGAGTLEFTMDQESLPQSNAGLIIKSVEIKPE